MNSPSVRGHFAFDKVGCREALSTSPGDVWNVCESLPGTSYARQKYKGTGLHCHWIGGKRGRNVTRMLDQAFQFRAAGCIWL
jgi:hypothetical protein